VLEGLVSFQLEVRDRSLDRRIRLLVLRGQLDRTTMPSVAATLKTPRSRQEPGVIVDITELTSLDTSGIALLRDTQSRLAGAGGWLAVVSDELCDARLPAAIRWGYAVDVFRSRAEAIAAVKRRIVLVRPTAVRSLLDVPVG
jgi:anti-anti-sigma regulatory factor